MEDVQQAFAFHCRAGAWLVVLLILQNPQGKGICDFAMTTADWQTKLQTLLYEALDQAELIAAEMMVVELEMALSQAELVAGQQKSALPHLSTDGR